MKHNDTAYIDAAAIARQYEFMERVRAMERPGALCYIDTYGCQQNEADSLRLKGMAFSMGYGITENAEEATLLLVNTCAIRDHAEQRVLSNVGFLGKDYRKNDERIICVCGCMAGRRTMVEKLKNRFPAVRIAFDTHALWRFAEILYTYKTTGKRQFVLQEDCHAIAEGLPAAPARGVRALLPISYGCNNFCAYCVVPFVRGRERSRKKEDVLAQARALVAAGYKDITLLGQNVNSYQGERGDGSDFARLLEEICAIDGTFRVRFMTSHPKDASPLLFDTMAREPKIAKALHLPVQSGSNEVLAAMNRKYTVQKYCELVAYARSKMPDLTLTSDVIVGFPTEGAAQFEETMQLLETVRFDALFTFIYSPRQGTLAADMKNCSEKEVISQRFQRLLARQNEITHEKSAEKIGKTIPILLEEMADGRLLGHSEGGLLTTVSNGAAHHIGQFLPCKITRTTVKSLYGHIV